MPQIEIDGRAVWYGTGGVEWRAGGRLAVLLHGAGQDHSVWASQARSLGQHGWNVAAPDLPGHGRSADAKEMDSVEACAVWLGRLLEAFGGDPVDLVGHSMGSCIALAFAASEPERVRRLALLSAGETMPVNPDLLEDALHRPARAHRFIAAFGHGRAAHFGGAETPGIWNLGATIALLERCPRDVLYRDFAACNEWDGTELATAVLCPTLVLTGQGDRMTPPRAGRALASHIPEARYGALSGSGHMMMAEAPGRLSRALLGFLRS